MDARSPDYSGCREEFLARVTERLGTYPSDFLPEMERITVSRERPSPPVWQPESSSLCSSANRPPGGGPKPGSSSFS